MNTVPPETYAKRRREFMERIGPDGVAILVANPESTRSHDTEYPYRASSDILYLTGFREPQTVLVLAPGHEDGEVTMFVRDRDPLREQWEGRRAGPDGAKANYGADAAFTVGELDEKLPAYLEDRERLYYTLGQHSEFDRRVTRWINTLRHRRNKPSGAPGALIDARDILHEMRLRKDDAEIEAIRRSVEVTSQAHILAMQHCRPGIYEYELEALIEYHFARNGAAFPAYSSIVGAGDNATILHYIENRDRIEDGDLVLVDAGCELGFYAGDLTRSFPASGKFSPAQRDVYQAVLDVQIATVEMIRPGVAYEEIKDFSTRGLCRAMLDLNLLSGTVDELMEEETYKKYYPHGIGHWMGIDVHDVGTYYEVGGDSQKLEPGMVLTIEPGLYVPAADEDAPEALRGIGVRIEDDILVTPDGHENMSKACPKTIAEIEALVGTSGQ
jgi:Xaa-Pro aminopeptidase